MNKDEAKGEILWSEGLGPYEGPELTAMQYEVLCRHALSREYGISVFSIQSGFREAPAMAGRKLRHQIDLYWTSSDGVCEFLVLANAKWQKSKVSLGALMTLIGVQHDIHAQKAMLITNSGYTPGVVEHAREKGIALLIVRPAADLDVGRIPEFPRLAATYLLEVVALERKSPVYRVHYVHKALGAGGGGAGEQPTPVRPVAYGVRPIVEGAAPQRQAVRPASVQNKMISSPGGAPRGPGNFGIRRK